MFAFGCRNRRLASLSCRSALTYCMQAPLYSAAHGICHWQLAINPITNQRQETFTGALTILTRVFGLYHFLSLLHSRKITPERLSLMARTRTDDRSLPPSALRLRAAQLGRLPITCAHIPPALSECTWASWLQCLRIFISW